MASNIAKAAAVGALAANGGGGNNGAVVPECPVKPLAEYHNPDVCLRKPSHPPQGHPERKLIKAALLASGNGASLVPNEQTVVCPLQLQTLENPSAAKGFDTTWIVENTSSKPVVISWVVNGIEYSPFEADKNAMDDPRAILKPGDWTSVPTFESFVYHVREIDEDGGAGNVVLQHRAGLIPIGNPHDYPCDASLPDVEPFDPDTGAVKQAFARTKTHAQRPCNTVDVGFRNQVGCPIHMYWANQLDHVPDEGFSCGEKFKLHLGTKPAPQDFFEDWNSMTKYEGSYVGHTFVARLASDPSVVIDKYTIQPTRVIDCPNLKQQVTVSTQEKVAEADAVAENYGTANQEGGEALEEAAETRDVTITAGGTIEAGAAAGAAAGGVSG